MNTKILSILMMLVIAAHVVSTSAVIASEKKRLQSQSASAETDDVVPEFGIDANTQFESLTSDQKAEMAWETLNEIQQNDPETVQHLGNLANLTENNYLGNQDFTDSTDALAFKKFEGLKEDAPYSDDQKTCLRYGGCALDLLTQITTLATNGYNDFLLEDLHNKITSEEYTLTEKSRIQSFSTNYDVQQKEGQLNGDVHHLHILKDIRGWGTIQVILSHMLSPGFADYMRESLPLDMIPNNHEGFFLTLKGYMGQVLAHMAAARPTDEEAAPPTDEEIAMGNAMSCIENFVDGDGNGCNNEVIFSTWRCAINGLKFDPVMVNEARIAKAGIEQMVTETNNDAELMNNIRDADFTNFGWVEIVNQSWIDAPITPAP